MRTVTRYTLYFITYSLLGALIETVFRLVTEGQLYAISGFLHLPLMPIYGFGALIIIAIYRAVKNPLLLFLAGTVAVTILEFVAHWLIEQIFGTRIWDYSHKPFNLDGRVSLDNSLGFGLAALGLIYGIHPVVRRFVKKLPLPLASVLAFGVGGIVLLDTILSTIQRLA